MKRIYKDILMLLVIILILSAFGFLTYKNIQVFKDYNSGACNLCSEQGHLVETPEDRISTCRDLLDYIGDSNDEENQQNILRKEIWP